MELQTYLRNMMLAVRRERRPETRLARKMVQAGTAD